MSESFKYDRLKFHKKGIQRNFILEAEKILNLTDSKLANKLNISRRTIYEWKNERITISQTAAIKISKLAKLSIPKDYKTIVWRIHLQKAGKIGGRNRLNMYGSVTLDEKYRKEKWKQWWESVGQYKKNAKGFQSILKIKIPRKSKLLAEFIGIMLGDGGVNQYHTTVTLSSKEKEYILFVSKVIMKLFNIKPKIYKLKYANAVDIVVNRKQLVDFCQTIGLVRGNKIKQQIDMPLWVKENKKFSQACIRGLIDTDGCFYTNSYVVKGKKYSYFKIAFTSASIPLINSVAKTLINFGINARISKNSKDVRIENIQYVRKYIKDIGSHNEKHLQKIRKWKVALNGKAAVC
jgi:DNA-binding XRE family transcriptional regulator